MKKLTVTYLLFTVLVFTTPVHAGSGHSHDKDGGHSNHESSHGAINASLAKAKAENMVNALVKKNVIDKSWQGTKPVKAEKKTFAKGEEWVVSFQNDKIEDKSKKVLYIFYSLDGHYIAANYTGK